MVNTYYLRRPEARLRPIKGYLQVVKIALFAIAAILMIAALVDRCCALAGRMAARLAGAPGVRILNDVVLNQVLVRFEAETPAASDALTRAVIARVQQDGVCWMGGTRWHGQEAMRVSVSTWSTTEADIDRSADAVLSAMRAVGTQKSTVS